MPIRKVFFSFVLLPLLASCFPGLGARTMLFSAKTATVSTLYDGSMALLQALRGVALAPDGTLYFSDGNRVRKLSGGVVTTLAGSTVQGEKDGTGDQATFFEPAGLTF